MHILGTSLQQLSHKRLSTRHGQIHNSITEYRQKKIAFDSNFGKRKLTCSKKEEVDAGTPAAAAPLSVAATSGSGGVAVAVAAGVADVGGCSGGSVRAVDAALLFSAVGGGGISSSEETLFHTL